MHKPPLILIADDEAEFREIFGEKLKQQGFWVAEARDGREVAGKAKALHPDLIIMDINMPNENGTEAVLDLKNDPATEDIKIVFFSNLKDPWPGLKKSHPEAAKLLGAADFIDKAGDLNEAFEKIRRYIGAS